MIQNNTLVYNMTKPLISIIIPAKNAGVFIEKTLESIISQSLNGWELILINDHSTDNTMDVVSMFVLEKRIKVIENEGAGIVEALITGFKHCKGEFITRMDADDLMVPNKLELLLHALEKAPLTSVSTGLIKYFKDQAEIKDGYLKYEKWMNNNLLSDNPYHDIFKECVIPSPSWMVHRSIIEKLDGFKCLQYPEDYDLAFRFLEMGLAVSVVPEVIHLWRDHEKRASRTDEHYAENTFLPLKLDWLLKLKPNKRFYVIGAGKKGKKIAQYFIHNMVDFLWFTNNEKKLIVPIYDKTLQRLVIEETMPDVCWIVAVSNPEEQQEIIANFTALDMQKGSDYLLFC
jgi:glycosyltransferase involved in cell wall biosynthesis